MVSRLPIELLSEIFLCVRDSSLADEAEKMYLDDYDNKWIRVSHVCASWRSIALSTPELWTIIRTHHNDMLQMLIRRSRNRKLTVVCGCLEDRSVMDAIMDELPRLERLAVCLCLSLDNTSDHTWVGLPAPHLRELLIDNPATVQPIPFPLLLLKSNMPALKSFHLLDNHFTWMAYALPSSLTSLTIVGLG